MVSPNRSDLIGGITNNTVNRNSVTALPVTSGTVIGPPGGPGFGVDNLLVDDNGDHLIIEDATIFVLLIED